MCVSYMCHTFLPNSVLLCLCMYVFLKVRAKGHEVLNIVLEHLGLTELQVFSLAVLRGQSAFVWELKRECFEFICGGGPQVREAATGDLMNLQNVWTWGTLKVPCYSHFQIFFFPFWTAVKQPQTINCPKTSLDFQKNTIFSLLFAAFC